jgi:hypothetical protein
MATDYNSHSTAIRLKHSKQLFTNYLNDGTSTMVKFSAEPRLPSPAKVVQHLKQSLNNFAPSLFNDLHFLVYETLAKHYNGTFVDSHEVVYSGPVVKRIHFKDSVFFQMYEKDKGII